MKNKKGLAVSLAVFLGLGGLAGYEYEKKEKVKLAEVQRVKELEKKRQLQAEAKALAEEVRLAELEKKKLKIIPDKHWPIGFIQKVKENMVLRKAELGEHVMLFDPGLVLDGGQPFTVVMDENNKTHIIFLEWDGKTYYGIQARKEPPKPAEPVFGTSDKSEQTQEAQDYKDESP